MKKEKSEKDNSKEPQKKLEDFKRDEIKISKRFFEQLKFESKGAE